MEQFLNDPYDDSQQQHKNEAPHWPADNATFTNLDDLQYTVAPEALGAHDLQGYGQLSMNQLLTLRPQPPTDPFLETFDFLGSPTQHATSPNLAAGGSDGWGDNIYADMDPLNNLDLLVLPEHVPTQNMTNTRNAFTSPQYFSPNSRGANFGQLNSIVEDSVLPSFHSRTFSPQQLRHGSVSIPPPLNSYMLQHLLSPRQHTYDGSLDTLKLPYSGTYLNSPPAMSLSQSSGANAAPSCVLSLNMHLPGSQHVNMGAPSAGSAPNTHIRKNPEPVTPKQLTLEEKARRRREFHNAVERRRRDLIKEKIKVLGFLVPPSLLTPQVCAVQTLLKEQSTNSKETKELLASVRIKDTKPNKAFILQTSVDYIRHLQYVLEKQRIRREELETAIAKLASPDRAGEVKQEPVYQNGKIGTYLSSEFDPDEFFSTDL